MPNWSIFFRLVPTCIFIWTTLKSSLIALFNSFFYFAFSTPFMILIIPAIPNIQIFCLVISFLIFHFKYKIQNNFWTWTFKRRKLQDMHVSDFNETKLYQGHQQQHKISKTVHVQLSTHFFKTDYLIARFINHFKENSK